MDIQQEIGLILSSSRRKWRVDIVAVAGGIAVLVALSQHIAVRERIAELEKQVEIVASEQGRRTSLVYSGGELDKSGDR